MTTASGGVIDGAHAGSWRGLLSFGVVVVVAVGRAVLVPGPELRSSIAVICVVLLLFLEWNRRRAAAVDPGGWGTLAVVLQLWVAALWISVFLPTAYHLLVPGLAAVTGGTWAIAMLVRRLDASEGDAEDVIDGGIIGLAAGLLTHEICRVADVPRPTTLVFAAVMLAAGTVVGLIFSISRNRASQPPTVRVLLCLGAMLMVVSGMGYIMFLPGRMGTHPTFSTIAIIAVGLMGLAVGMVGDDPDSAEQARSGLLEWIGPMLLGAPVAGVLGVLSMSGVLGPDPYTAGGLALLLLLLMPRGVSAFVGREQAVRAQERERHRLTTMLADVGGMVYVLTEDSTVRWHSTATGGVGGVGRMLLDSVDDRDVPVFKKAIRDVIRGGPGTRALFEGRSNVPDALDRWFEGLLVNRCEDPAIRGLLLVVNDVTQRHRDRERMTTMARTDALTGLANRLTIRETLVERIARDGEDLAVVFCDLDGFKIINDSLGHHVGDRMLQMVARRFLGSIGPGDVLGRIGGDEFAVITGRAQAHERATQLIESLAEPVRLGPHVLPIGASVGIATAVDDSDPDALIRDADAAMYRAKERGRGQVAVFDRSMHEEAMQQLSMTAEMEDALREGQFSLVYQPVVRTTLEALPGLVLLHEGNEPGAVASFEALIRWNHPVHGVILPTAFIHIAEKAGLIGRLGGFVVEEACGALARLRRFQPSLTMAVNVSPIQLLDPDFPERVIDVLSRHGLTPDALVLEVTEGTVIDHEGPAMFSLGRLHAMGVGLSLDDFGTGYSALGYLGRIGWTGLKIDQSFVADVVHDAGRRSVVAGIVDIATSLQMQVIAEGVETDAQRRVMQELRCPLMQGFLFAHPMSLADVELSFSDP